MDYVWKWANGIGWYKETKPEVMRARMDRMVWACFNCGYIYKKDEYGVCPKCGRFLVYLKSFKGGGK